MQERDFKGIWIPKDIWLNTELSIVERALFAEIDSLDTNAHCVAGNDYFSNFFGVSESTITRAIAHLKELGLITSSFNGRVRTLRVVKMTTQSSQNDEGIKLSNNINTRDISNNNNQQELFTDNNNKEVLEVRNKGQKFVADYNAICKSLPKCQRLTPKRTKGISNILKKYSYDDILTVFNKLEASDFCTGKTNGWRADIDFILREDKFISILEGKYDNRKSRRGNGKSVETTSLKEGEVARVVTKEEENELRRMVERGELEEY